MSAPEENRARVRKWYEESSNHHRSPAKVPETGPAVTDKDRITSLGEDFFSPGAVMHFPDGDGDVGRIIRYHLTMLDAFPDAIFLIDDLIADDDKVAVRGRIMGTNTGAFMGRPSTGNVVEMAFITIYRFYGGKVVESWGCSDMAGFLRQLGIMPGE